METIVFNSIQVTTGLTYTVHWDLYINKPKSLALISEASQIRT